MKKYRRLSKKFIVLETEKMGVKRERVIEEAVESFLTFVEERRINITELDDINQLDELDLIEYFILLKDKSGDNLELIKQYAQINLRFLNYLKDTGYIKKDDREYNDRVKEKEAEYLCA